MPGQDMTNVRVVLIAAAVSTGSGWDRSAEILIRQRA